MKYGYVQNATPVSVKQNSSDEVKRFMLDGNLFRVYELNTQRGKPYFLDVVWSNGATEDLGYFRTVAEAVRKGKRENRQYKG